MINVLKRDWKRLFLRLQITRYSNMEVEVIVCRPWISSTGSFDIRLCSNSSIRRYRFEYLNQWIYGSGKMYEYSLSGPQTPYPNRINLQAVLNIIFPWFSIVINSLFRHGNVLLPMKFVWIRRSPNISTFNHCLTFRIFI